MKNSRKRTPVSELNLDSSIQKIKDDLLEKQERVRNERIEDLESISLEKIANEIYSDYGEYDYTPYLLDFGMVLDRIKGDNRHDAFEDSLKVKMDLLEQISKMKYVPPFNTECHIESDKWNKCTSLWSFIRKNILRQKKYRLIFHGKEADYKKEKYSTFIGKIIYVLF